MDVRAVKEGDSSSPTKVRRFDSCSTHNFTYFCVAVAALQGFCGSMVECFPSKEMTRVRFPTEANDRIAQWIERSTSDRDVEGSTPSVAEMVWNFPTKSSWWTRIGNPVRMEKNRVNYRGNLLGSFPFVTGRVRAGQKESLTLLERLSSRSTGSRSSVG